MLPTDRELMQSQRRTSRKSGSNTRKTKTEALRNMLMENYLHLVRYNAERIHVKLPDEVELDDLMSAGIFGLMDAINAFDLERGVKFETYCAPASAARSSTSCARWTGCPRLVRSRAHKLDSASKQLEVELGRSPDQRRNRQAAEGLDGRVREDGQGRQRRRPGLAVAANGSKPTATRTSARSTSWKTSAAPIPSAKSSARISRN